MKKKLLSLALCLVLLAGCGPDLSQYPAVSSSPPPAVETQVLTIDIPRDVDPLTQDALTGFAAAVLELSGGAITIETIPNTEPLSALAHGATHMALVDNQTLIEAEPSLSFLDWPFLFSGPEDYFTAMGAEDGPVRGKPRLEETLGGRIISVWYSGTTVLLGRGAFYDEICFSNSDLGVLEGRGASGLFTGIGSDLGARTVYEEEPDRLLTLLDDRTVKYIEYPLEALSPEELPESVKHLENTCHRIQGMWLILGTGLVDSQTAQILEAAAAYVPQPALDSRRAAQGELLAQIEAAGVKVTTGDYTNLLRAAHSYYQEHYLELGCTQRSWDLLSPLL